MKKRNVVFIGLVLCASILCGCSGETLKGYVFETLYGDVISVAINTDGGYNLKKSNGHFTIVKDKITVLNGYLANEDDWENYARAVDDGTVTLIEKTDEKMVWKDGSEIYSLTYGSGISYVMTKSTISEDTSEEMIRDAISKLRVEFTAETAGDRLYP